MAQPNSKQARRRQPISRHPLFPAIVALWFAAPLGIGSFALSTSLLETLVLAAHVDSLVPAAAPPLGATARLLLALVLGLLGGAIGWVLAARVAAPKDDTVPQVFKVADADLGEQEQWPGTAETAARPEPKVAEPVPVLDPASLLADAEVDEPLPAVEVAQEAIPQEAMTQEVIPAEQPAPRAPTAAQRIAAADLTELSHVELVERLAIALKRREELFGTAPDEAAERASPVLHFPDFADRRSARAVPPAAQFRPAPQETEKALREALAQLQRMSGSA